MEGCAVPRYMVARFPDEGVSARAVFLDDEAPRTCAAMWDALPAAGDGMHGSYSGTVVGLFIDPTIVVSEENATSCIQTGDVLFTHYEPNVRHGHHFPVSEIYWAYDRYARPTIPGQWVPAIANVFARFVDDPSPFYAACRRIPKEGWKRLELTRGEAG
jgi:hypothetical protein